MNWAATDAWHKEITRSANEYRSERILLELNREDRFEALI